MLPLDVMEPGDRDRLGQGKDEYRLEAVDVEALGEAGYDGRKT
jgi:hypothetical protein